MPKSVPSGSKVLASSSSTAEGTRHFFFYGKVGVQLRGSNPLPASPALRCFPRCCEPAYSSVGATATWEPCSRVAAAPLAATREHTHPCSRVAAAPLVATWGREQQQQQHGSCAILWIAARRATRGFRLPHRRRNPPPPSPRSRPAFTKSSPRNYIPLHSFTFTPPRTPKNL